MKHLLNSILLEAAKKISDLFPGSAHYGIAKSAIKDDRIYPYVNEKYIGVDDTYSFITYYRINTVTTKLLPGYGDQIGDLQNIFSFSLIAFNNKKLTKLDKEDLFLLIQSRLSMKLTIPPFKKLQITPTGGVLDSVLVYRSEYQSESFGLRDSQDLIAINFSLEAVFKQDCFINCPEDLKCKN